MKWEKAAGSDWWFVYGVCIVEKSLGARKLRRWGVPDAIGSYPTLEAAMLAAEMIFG